jgi:hypothetical protein
MKMQVETALGAMDIISRGANGCISALGITPEELKLTTGPVAWVGADRHTVTKCFESMVYGSMDLQNLPRFRAPAEYIAAAIMMFTSPCNYFAACCYMSGGTKMDPMAAKTDQDGGSRAPVTAEELFSLILMCNPYTKQIEQFKAQFTKNCGLALHNQIVYNEEGTAKQIKGK